MKINPGCTYCLLSRIHYQSKLVTDDDDLINRVMKECIAELNREYDPIKHQRMSERLFIESVLKFWKTPILILKLKK